MTKRAKKKKKVAGKPSLRPQENLKGVRLIEYEITEEPVTDQRYDLLPENVKDEIERLHYDAQKNPHQAIPKLVDLIEKYPDIPMLYNYLSIAYSRTGQREKVKEVVLDNYQRNPKYLFARLNYAEICLKDRDFAQIEEIFEHKYDLKLLYPKRKRFHLSEVANFMGFMGVYLLEIGEREAAKMYDKVLQEIAPSYPMAKRLHKRLHPGLIGRILSRMLDQGPSESL